MLTMKEAGEAANQAVAWVSSIEAGQRVLLAAIRSGNLEEREADGMVELLIDTTARLANLIGEIEVTLRFGESEQANAAAVGKDAGRTEGARQ